MAHLFGLDIQDDCFNALFPCTSRSLQRTLHTDSAPVPEQLFEGSVAEFRLPIFYGFLFSVSSLATHLAQPPLVTPYPVLFSISH